MSTFDDREHAFEAKFAHDAELMFRAEARRNRLIGTWAGEQLGKSGDDLDAYIRDVIKSDFQEAGDNDVLEKVAADLDGKATADEVRVKMDECMLAAKQQILAEAD